MASGTKFSTSAFLHSSFYSGYFLFIGLLVVAPDILAQTDPSFVTIADANTSRLIVSPTARSLKEDNGYINLAEIIFPNFGYGITDEFMVRGGFTPFTVSGKILYFGLAALQVADYGDLTIAGGIIMTDITGTARNWENTLYGYGMISYGNDIAAIHAGFGGGYSSHKESSSALLMIGGEWKVARTTRLITENWLVSETGSSALSLGVRIFGKTLTGELGGVVITAQHSLRVESIIPWIGLTFIL